MTKQPKNTKELKGDIDKFEGSAYPAGQHEENEIVIRLGRVKEFIHRGRKMTKRMKIEECAKPLIRNTLQLFPEVKWDRYSGGLAGKCVFFGWLDREDQYKDFMIIVFNDGEYQFFYTSSPWYSKEFSERIGGKHYKCFRAEDLGLEGVECVKLKNG